MRMLYSDCKVTNSDYDASVECFDHQQGSVQKLLVRRLYFTDCGAVV